MRQGGRANIPRQRKLSVCHTTIREAERGTNPQALAVQGNVEEETLAIHRGRKAMGTKLERIS